MTIASHVGTDHGAVAVQSTGDLDWPSRLRGWTLADIENAFEKLPNDLQRELSAALPATPPVRAPPSTVAGGSVAWLLDELKLAALYGETFEEYGLSVVQQLSDLDHDELAERLRDLGVTQDHRDQIARLARSPRPCGASGGCFDRSFLHTCRPLHAQHMGCENMGPLLYSLIRFTKARQVLEVGAGYTSLWILQALADNDAELARCAAAVDADGYRVAQAEWMVAASETATGDGATEHGDWIPTPSTAHCWAAEVSAQRCSQLHAIDDMGAAEGGNRGTAHLVCDAASRLGLRRYLSLHEGDAYSLAGMELSAEGSGQGGGEGGGHGQGGREQTGGNNQAGGERRGGEGGGQGAQLDVLWLDFGLGTGARIESFLEAWWPRLRPGGYLILHSTLTNAVTRAWLEMQRERLRTPVQPDGGATCSKHVPKRARLSGASGRRALSAATPLAAPPRHLQHRHATSSPRPFACARLWLQGPAMVQRRGATLASSRPSLSSSRTSATRTHAPSSRSETTDGLSRCTPPTLDGQRFGVQSTQRLAC